MSRLTDKMYDELAAQRDDLAAKLAGCQQQLAMAPTYEKMIAHHGVQEQRIELLERTAQALWAEIIASGNAGSKDYGWPVCRALFFECFPSIKGVSE